MNRKFLAFCFVTLIAAPCFGGQILDFEDGALLGGDNTLLSDQYLSSHGVSFSMLAGRTKDTAVSASAALEQVGRQGRRDPITGFISRQGADRAASGYESQLGNYFLTNNARLRNTGYVKLSMDYANSLKAISGDIWDIDGGRRGTEQFQVTAFNANGDAVASLLSPEGRGNSLDGLPWTWSLAGKGIRRVDIEFVGTKRRGVGFGIDNLQATSNPLPGAVWLGGMGMVWLAGSRRKRRQAVS